MPVQVGQEVLACSTWAERIGQALLESGCQTLRDVADKLLDGRKGAEQEVQCSDQAFVLLRFQPTQGMQVEQTAAASHQVGHGRSGGGRVGGVAVLGVDPQAVAQSPAVSPPGLRNLAHELVEDGHIACDESCIQKTGRRRPRAAGVGGALHESPHARLDTDVVLPERVADGLGHPWR